MCMQLATGNWSPGDFPEGRSWPPFSQLHRSINRDLVIVLEHKDLVDYFHKVYNSDWAAGEEWEPKK